MEQVRWARHVAHMDGTRNVQIFFPENRKETALSKKKKSKAIP
jgi:hypothetical protein